MKKVILAITVLMLAFAGTSCKEKEITSSYPMQAESVRVEVYGEEKDAEYAESVVEQVSRIHDSIYEKMHMKLDEKMTFILYFRF